MKTPEELAEEWLINNQSELMTNYDSFLAGYQAAQEHAHAALEEAEARIQELQDQLADTSKVMPDTCEHILDMSKMVDVNGWVSVKERMPEKNSEMLLLMCVDGYELGYYERYTSYGWTNVLGTDCLNVTHWQELPEPPKEEG